MESKRKAGSRIQAIATWIALATAFAAAGSALEESRAVDRMRARAEAIEERSKIDETTIAALAGRIHSTNLDVNRLSTIMLQVVGGDPDEAHAPSATSDATKPDAAPPRTK